MVYSEDEKQSDTKSTQAEAATMEEQKKELIGVIGTDSNRLMFGESAGGSRLPYSLYP